MKQLYILIFILFLAPVTYASNEFFPDFPENIIFQIIQTDIGTLKA